MGQIDESKAGAKQGGTGHMGMPVAKVYWNRWRDWLRIGLSGRIMLVAYAPGEIMMEYLKRSKISNKLHNYFTVDSHETSIMYIIL